MNAHPGGPVSRVRSARRVPRPMDDITYISSLGNSILSVDCGAHSDSLDALYIREILYFRRRATRVTRDTVTPTPARPDTGRLRQAPTGRATHVSAPRVTLLSRDRENDQS